MENYGLGCFQAEGSILGHASHVASPPFKGWEVQSSPVSGREEGLEIRARGSSVYHMGEHNESSKQVCAPGGA